MSEAQEVEEKVDEVKLQIRAAFDDAIDTTDDEDQVKMAMIATGATFKNVTRLFNEFMVDSGRLASKTEKNEAVAKVLEGQDLSTEENFTSLAAALKEEVPTLSDIQCASLIRAYGKKNDLDVYKKPKAAGGGGANGFTHRFYTYLESNPGCSPDEAKSFIHNDEKSSENVVRHEKHYLNIASLVNKVAAQIAA